MIYELSKAVARFGYHQAKNIGKLILGYPLTTPSLGSVTLDHDDLLIAKSQLRNREGWFNPDIVKEYEDAFAIWNGSKHAFAFMGGRVALSACIYALNLKPGDEVILPGYTCVVVPNAFHFAGIKTVYSDIELDTYGLDASLIEEKITSKTKVILLHHLYGIVCRDYEQIIKIAKRHNFRKFG
jgi:dTDP-4-amino-4,6-dideoxygalactose transaminase